MMGPNFFFTMLTVWLKEITCTTMLLLEGNFSPFFFFWEQKKLGGQIRREPWPRKWFLLVGTADDFSNLNVLQQNFCCRKKKLFSFPTQQILARSVKKRRSYRSSCKVERFADKFVTVTMRKDPVRRHKRLDFPRWQRFIWIYTGMWPAVISLAHAWRCKDHRSNGRDLNFYPSWLWLNTPEHSEHQLKFVSPRSISLVSLAFITWWRPGEPNRNVVENKLLLVHWLIVISSVNQVPAGKVGWCHQAFILEQVKRRSVEL